ncbi:unnamed protein product [Rotaria sp. Silwood2]|nr:unnamed protein product [Rotaria sp. Silwood2]
MKLKYQEVQGNLFSASSTISLAHCVSTDMNMSKGIATQFRNQFGRIDDLKRQNIGVGGCAYIYVENRHVFYLITKQRYFHKPTLKTLEASLISMRDLCIQNNINQLAMPCIGCGLDKLQWSQVKELIQSIFGQVDIEITIYVKNGPPAAAPSRKRRGIAATRDHKGRNEATPELEPYVKRSRRGRDQSTARPNNKT